MEHRYFAKFLAAAAIASSALFTTNLEAAKKYSFDILAPQGESSPSGVFYFRNDFNLAEAPQKLVVNLAADNKYKLFVNGKYVCRGSESGDLKNWFFDAVDIAPFLKLGGNYIVVAVVQFGARGARPDGYMSKGTSFWLKAEPKEFEFLDTQCDGWKYIKDGGVKFDAKATWALSGGVEIIDAAKTAKGWNAPKADMSAWREPKRIAVADFNPPRKFFASFYKIFVPRMLPPLSETFARVKTVRKAEGLAGKTPADIGFINGKPLEIPANTKCKIILDMRELANAYTALSTSGGAGAEIRLSYCESFSDAKKGDRRGKGNRNVIDGKKPFEPLTDIYKTDGSETVFESFNFRCFRYIQLDVETRADPLVIKDFTLTTTGYPFEARGKFDSSDKSLNDIWSVGWRTARLCAVDTYYDCPFYERLQYVGDTRIQALISLYAAGDPRLMKKAIKMFNVSRQDYGITQSRYPCDMTQYIPPFSLYWINMVFDYHMHVGEPEFVEENLDGIETVINWFAAHIDKNTGMLKSDMPFWSFVDWVRDWKMGVPPAGKKSGSAVNSLHLALALDDAAKLMERFGRGYAAERYKAMSKSIKQSVYKRCWNPGRGLLADTEGAELFSQHSNIMGILTGAIPAADRNAVLTRIIEGAKSSYAPHKSDDIMEATFYYKFYLFKALEKQGRGGEFLDLLQPWRDMLAFGLTTFAENPEPTRSDCHAWSASPLYYFGSLVCGVRPAAEGFSRVLVRPDLGKLKFARCAVPHPKGLILAEFERGAAPHGVSAKITLPEGVEGDFVWRGETFKLSGGTQTFVLPKPKERARVVHGR